MEYGTRWHDDMAEACMERGTRALEDLEPYQLKSLADYVAVVQADGSEYQRLRVKVLAACVEVETRDRRVAQMMAAL